MTSRASNLALVAEAPTVFVGYPWAPYDRDEYKACYRVLERKYGVTFVFAEERLTTEYVLVKIEQLMVVAQFCIFDLSGKNFNVGVEYGLARGLRLETYVAFNPTLGVDEEPSDLRGLDSLRYKTLGELRDGLDRLLGSALAPEERARRERASRAPIDRELFDEELARE